MWKQESILPVFSLAVNRKVPTGTAAGYLTLGGIPPVPFTSPLVSTPIKSSGPSIAIGPSDPGGYSITVEGMTFQAGVSSSAGNVTAAPIPPPIRLL